MEWTRRIGALSYGAICYAIFFATFLYLIGFLGNFAVPKSIDSGAAGPVGTALLVDFALLALFGLQHSVMARPGWKRVFTRIVPRAVERSSYVLASSAALILLFWQWRPMPTMLFKLDNDVAFSIATGIYFLGYAIILEATFLIDHFDLFGLRQVFLRGVGRPYTEKRFVTPALYKIIRHPLYLGWLIAFWVTPALSVGHLLFASVMSAYILIAIPLEERDLAAQLGAQYVAWRERTPAFVPRIRRKTREQPRRAVEDVR